MKKFINLLLISIILLSLTAVTGAHASGTAFSISGQVVDRYGDPLPGASVQLIDFNYKVIGTRTTGDDGNFDFVNVVAETDTCTVKVTYTDSNNKEYDMPQYYARWYPTKGIQVIPSKETQVPGYPEPNYGYVYGAIQTSTGSGATFTNGIVYLVSMDNNNKYYEFADRTDGKGSYSFYVLPGTYRLYAQHWENGVCYESSPKQVTVGRNVDQTDPSLVPTPIILPLTNPNSNPDPSEAPVHHENKVYGNVTTKDGKAWAGATVTLLEQSDNGSGYITMKDSNSQPLTTVTDSNGYYQFYAISPTTDDGRTIQSVKNIKVSVSYTDPNGKQQTITADNRDSKQLYYPDVIMEYGVDDVARNIAMPTVQLDFAQMGWVKLQSSPSGATVYVDGQPLYDGNRQPITTPQTVYLDPGPHEIKMSKDGYQDATEEVTMVANQEYTDFQPVQMQRTLVPQWVTAAVAIIILLIVIALIIALLATRIKGAFGKLLGGFGHRMNDYKANRDSARVQRAEMAEQRRMEKQMRSEEKMDSRRESLRMRPEGMQSSRDDMHAVNIDPVRKRHDAGMAAEGGKKKILDIDLKQITGSVPKKIRPRDAADSPKERSPVVFASDIYKKSSADVERIPYESSSRSYEQPPARSRGSSGGGWSYGPESYDDQPSTPSYRTETSYRAETYEPPSRQYVRPQPVDERESLVERPSMPERSERFRVPRTSGQRDPGSSLGEKDRVLRYIKEHAEGVSFIQMSNDLEIIPNNLTYITKELVINDDIEKVKGLYYYKSHASPADEKSSSVVVWRLDADK